MPVDEECDAVHGERLLRAMRFGVRAHELLHDKSNEARTAWSGGIGRHR